MKKIARSIVLVLLLFLWLFLGTLLLSRWWYANPDYFPRLPNSFWKWLDNLFGASNVDAASNVELFVVVSLALVIVSGVTFLGLLGWRHVRKKRLAASAHG